MATRKDHKIKLVLTVGASLSLLIVASAVAYYFVLYIPGKDKARLETLQQNKILLDKCIADADASLNYTWGMACFRIQNALGQKEDPDCPLPSSSAQAIKKTRTEQVELCLKLYPIEWKKKTV